MNPDLPATDPTRGLDEAEALRRLGQDGRNRLPQPERRSILGIVLHVLREPMLLLLLAATAVYLLLGDPAEAAILSVSVVLVVVMTVAQEQRSERALQALRELGSPQARVLREGRLRRIAAEELVYGDVILVAEGERVPADARLLEATDLHIDESLLTGESVAVARGPGPGEEHLIRASTLVVRGRAEAEVCAIGSETAVGRIGAALHAIRPQATPLQREIRRVVGLFAIASFLACALVAGFHYLLRGDLMASLLAGITLAIATIPEEFPVVLTVFLAIGAWRMAQHRVLLRRASAIEALGSISVLCTDKTGTLTENRMAVAELVPEGAQSDSIGLLRLAHAAGRPESLDPMERALRARMDADHLEAFAGLHLREYPLTPQRPALAHAWKLQDQVLLACKGAPETVASLCHLDAGQQDRLVTQVARLAAQGLRVLGVAGNHWKPDAALPSSLDEAGLQWHGLVAFADPLRATVPAAVAEAQGAGIRVLMLTGDHLATARAIAAQAGIAGAGPVLTGSDLDALDAASLQGQVARVPIYARVRPEQKLRLVESLRAQGEVVAMTGDGVNDAPALAAAHVGIAMGGRGTDVAREAAAIVLLDDDFSSIVRAVRMGRAIYDNIRRAMRYILAVHVPITGLALLPLFTGGPLILLPLHVVFLELIIDPACSIVFEREQPAADLMTRKPRPTSEAILGLYALLSGLVHGLAMFVLVACVYVWADRGLHLLPAQSGALAFTTLVAGNVGLILLYRSGGGGLQRLRQSNRAFWLVLGLALGLLTLATRAPASAAWFGFAPPPSGPWWIALFMPLALAPILMLFQRRR